MFVVIYGRGVEMKTLELVDRHPTKPTRIAVVDMNTYVGISVKYKDEWLGRLWDGRPAQVRKVRDWLTKWLAKQR